MRVSRLRATNFRGWSELDLRQSGAVVVVGEPRAGRTDVVVALTRVLDPRSTRLSPVLTDIHQRLKAATADDTPTTEGGTTGGLSESDTAHASAAPDEVGTVPAAAPIRRTPPLASAPDSDEVTGNVTAEAPDEEAPDVSTDVSTVIRAQFAEVELTLVGLGVDIEQEMPGVPEPLTTEQIVDESGSANPNAPLGVRMTYRVTYDVTADTVGHVLYFPAVSNPEAGHFVRVPAAVRLMLPVVFLDTARPLQLRAEGLLRRLLAARDPEAVSVALRALEAQIVDAAGSLSHTGIIADLLNAVLSDTGPARRAGDRPLTADDVQFLPDDGSLAGILRALQPVVALDRAGPLALESHGSTTSAVLAASEALIMAMLTPGAVIVGDDFGEGLDGGSAEHLAAAFKTGADQVWLTTRRAEVARAFEVVDIVRLTRRGGARHVHRAPAPADKKEVAVHRHLQAQLLPALTATTVAIVEGRHDLTAYTAADRLSRPPALPLSAHGIRIITADNGAGGGTTQIPRIATLFKSLGYRVVGLVDRDPAKNSDAVVTAIDSACHAVVRLPDTMALERAILAGAQPSHLRQAAAVLTEFAQADPTVGRSDDQLGHALMQALHRTGLHEPFLVALIQASSSVPPVVRDALDKIAILGGTGYSGPKRVDLSYAAPAE